MSDREETAGAASAEAWRLDPASARTEAERLVATGMAAVSMAADRIGAPTRERGGAAAASFDAIGDMLFGPTGHRRHNVANDSPECCKCPICRAISAAREPDPEVTEKLATGVGNLAEGAARALRTVAGAAAAWQPPPRDEPADQARESAQAREPAQERKADREREDDPWAAATAAAVTTPAPVTTPLPAPADEQASSE